MSEIGKNLPPVRPTDGASALHEVKAPKTATKPGLVDPSSINGGALVSTERFQPAVDATVAQAVINGLFGAVKGLTRLSKSPPPTPAELGAKLIPRLEQLAANFTQAGTAEVLSALDLAARGALETAAAEVREGLTQLASSGTLAKVPRLPKDLVAQLEATCTAILAKAAAGLAPESAVLLNGNAKTVAALFDTDLPTRGDVAVYIEGAPSPGTLALIAELVRARPGALNFEDVEIGAKSRVYGRAGLACTDDPGWAKLCPALTLELPLPTGAIEAEVRRLAEMGVANLRFVVSSNDASAVRSLAPLLSLSLGPTVELVDETGRGFAKIDPVAGPTLSPPDRLSAELHDAYRSLIRGWLQGGVGRTLHVPANGDLLRTESGYELKLKGGKGPLQRDLRFEALAHSALSALDPAHNTPQVGQALRTILGAAQSYLEQPVGREHASLQDPATWTDAMNGIRQLATVPQWSRLVSRLLTDVATHSEHPHHPGFGNPLLRGAALGANSVALLELLSGLGSSTLAGVLQEATSLLGSQGHGVTVAGATLGILAQKELGPWPRRASAANEQATLLRLIDEALRTTVDGATTVAISAIPTDPGQGTARTVTPDFAVEQSTPGGARSIFLDAKTIDARYFDHQAKDNVKTAVHQVLGHRLKLGKQTEGWPFLRLYNAPTDQKAKAELLSSVQAALQSGLVDNPRAKTGNSANLRAIVVLDHGGEQETYLVRTHSSQPLSEPFFRIGLGEGS